MPENTLLSVKNCKYRGMLGNSASRPPVSYLLQLETFPAGTFRIRYRLYSPDS